MSRRRRQVTRAEANLWRLVVRDAEPLSPSRRRALEDRIAPAPEPVVATTNAAEAPPRPPEAQPAPPAPVRPRRESLPQLEHGRLPGVDRRTAQRMRRGQYDIDAVLDLHGMGREAAHDALAGFIASSQQAGLRCVLVVTGKGRRGSGEGVLRASVPRWLNEGELRARILGFSHARPQHGGEGALYVLLKRRR